MTDHILYERAIEEEVEQILEPLAALSDCSGPLWRVRQSFREAQRMGIKTFVALYNGDPMIVGTATLVVLPKISHGGAYAGLVEDVAVHPDFQGQGIGRGLVEACLKEARRLGCYKVVLACDDDVIGFYEKLGFSPRGHAMRLDCGVCE